MRVVGPPKCCMLHVASCKFLAYTREEFHKIFALLFARYKKMCYLCRDILFGYVMRLKTFSKFILQNGGGKIRTSHNLSVSIFNGFNPRLLAPLTGGTRGRTFVPSPSSPSYSPPAAATTPPAPCRPPSPVPSLPTAPPPLPQ